MFGTVILSIPSWVVRDPLVVTLLHGHPAKLLSKCYIHRLELFSSLVREASLRSGQQSSCFENKRLVFSLKKDIPCHHHHN